MSQAGQGLIIVTGDILMGKRRMRMGALIVTVAMIATACHFGSQSGSGVYLLPDRDMSIRASSGIGGVARHYEGFQWSVLDYAFNTVLNPRLSRGNCSPEWHRICAFGGNHGDNGYAGWYSCQGPVRGSHPNRTCDHAHIYFNTYYRTARDNPIKLACHELGHAVGMHHRAEQSSCMKTGLPASTKLDGHDREEINANY